MRLLRGLRAESGCRQGKSPRIVQVDEYEPVRRRVAAATKSTAGRAAYKRRCWICETPFAFIKQWMNFRQCLLRGLEKVRTEWLAGCGLADLGPGWESCQPGLVFAPPMRPIDK
jgi:hypothetical protein